MTSDSMILTVANRLSKYPPFDKLDRELLDRIAKGVRIRYLEPGEVVFEQGSTPGPEFYVLVKGEIQVIQRVDGADVLADVCDDGDIFGVRALLGDRPYAASTRAKDDTLLYVLSKDQLHELVAEAPRVAMFFAADFAGDVPQLGETNRLIAVRAARRHERASETGDDVRRVDPVRDVLTCGMETTIREAASMMSERNVGSILVVDADRRPLGIVTDSDLRSKVVGQGRDVSELISAIMSSPVLTIDEQTTLSSMIATVMKKHLHHFAVTEDGTPHTPVTGIVSEHDILKTQGSHPTVILTEISRAKTKERLRVLRDQAEELLRQYLQDEVGMSFLANMISEINDTLIRRAIRLSLEELDSRGLQPPVPFCWLALGSEGREEQLLRTDQDNAILYADPGEDDGRAERFFLELGELVVDILVEAGFERCPGDVMASNPKWNQPLGAWKRCFSQWIREPENVAVMHTNIFFDFRPVYGENALAAELKGHIFESITVDRSFLSFFALNATRNPPPLSFFRNMIVERSGEHRDAFDIKARAMMPLADAARVLVYDLGIDIYGSTAERWQRIGETHEHLARLAGEAGMAYEILMRIRALEGLNRGTSGRYVHIKELNKLERQTVRNTFSVVKDVQLMLTSRYRTDFLR
ncbi:MAG: CBS domain-containing protein [Myxococcales bacterium]|nr:CBS domain-containing protein [Myxococcales bacterium]